MVWMANMKTKKLYEKFYCVQCGNKLTSGLELSECFVPVCLNPKCPNYGLLQIGEKNESI